MFFVCVCVCVCVVHRHFISYVCATFFHSPTSCASSWSSS